MPVGVEAAKAAGMTVIAVATTCAPEQLTGADHTIRRFTELTVPRVAAMVR